MGGWCGPRSAGPSGCSRRDYGELSIADCKVAIPDREHQAITYVLPKDRQRRAAYQNSPGRRVFSPVRGTYLILYQPALTLTFLGFRIP